MIPKTIFTIWLSEDKLIPDITKTHELAGYEHQIITLDNCFKDSRFLKEALNAKKWVKAVDYLRAYYLYKDGGIYLDCDAEVLKPFDSLLGCDMFIGQESNGVYANGVIGSTAGHPLLKEYMRRLDDNFRGDGDLTFEPGVRAFSDLVWLKKYNVTILEPEIFYPKHITPNSISFHHYTNSWL